MIVVHLTASFFFGGPERQMLGLAETLRPGVHSVFVSFSEKGRCQAFLDEVRRRGFPAHQLTHDTPHLPAAVGELTRWLRDTRADVLCCHGYKANLLGLLAARWLRIPVVAVSRGWTGETLRVRLYDALDRRVLRWIDHVVCVSQMQADQVRRAGVPPERIIVVRNAIRGERFDHPSPKYRERLQALFPATPRWIVGAAGRLSPEKGFDVLVDAAAEVLQHRSDAGFVIFGDGVLRDPLVRRIAAKGMAGQFVLAGFRSDLDKFLPHFDLLTIPSFTEGLPNVALEALAAGVPVVATAVGGTPEIVEEGVCGRLVPPGDAAALARCIEESLTDQRGRAAMGRQGREHVQCRFSFAEQGAEYQRLFRDLCAASQAAGRSPAPQRQEVCRPSP